MINTDRPLVTVYCSTYNHEKYIRSALNGFVMQKTNFPFEVIIHDDASTDNTTEIIREYVEKYPDIIKPIFQTENQYSKGKKIFSNFVLPIARGKYCASCEGDDYWTDENKLQLQVDFLETHPDYSACVHNTKVLNSKTNKFEGIIGKKNGDVTMDELIKWNNSEGYHTSSLLCRMKFKKNLPEFTRKAKKIGDYPLALYLRTCGKIYRINKIMSTYRILADGSWSSQQNKKSTIENNLDLINILGSFNEFTNNEFFDIIQCKQNELRLKNAILEKKYNEIKNSELIIAYRQASFKIKLKIFLLHYFPFIIKLKRKIFHQKDI